MAEQCKTPLDWQKPNINICILEKGHESEYHETYGLGWGLIKYRSPNKFLINLHKTQK